MPSGYLQVLEVALPGLSHFLKVGRCQTGYLLELIGQVRHTAVMQLIGDLSQVKLIVQQKFFHPFNLVHNDKLLNRDSLYF